MHTRARRAPATPPPNPAAASQQRTLHSLQSCGSCAACGGSFAAAPHLRLAQLLRDRLQLVERNVGVLPVALGLELALLRRLHVVL